MLQTVLALTTQSVLHNCHLFYRLYMFQSCAREQQIDGGKYSRGVMNPPPSADNLQCDISAIFKRGKSELCKMSGESPTSYCCGISLESIIAIAATNAVS